MQIKFDDIVQPLNDRFKTEKQKQVKTKSTQIKR